jgi:hypothetical protein
MSFIACGDRRRSLRLEEKEIKAKDHYTVNTTGLEMCMLCTTELGGSVTRCIMRGHQGSDRITFVPAVPPKAKKMYFV